MGWSETEPACRKHPNDDQGQGICPSCLREKLSQLYLIPPLAKPAMVAPSCSSLTSFSSSSSPNQQGSSPPPSRRRWHQRNASQTVRCGSFKVVGEGLKKSRSMAVVVSRSIEGEVKSEKKRKGFWSRLLHLKGNKESAALTTKQM
ncbi:hypothetical protein K2173_014870 [Erythroxylum novogranatense]|uniref:Uncharacterized protein n=1 Tax=Erythroxylum novogranatense TaxID=1862640 RepID=A0AAV8TG93_9ROSI|nr:hypothetical protein K2173_014870 [Erythroxylum novogranatense]